MTIGMSRADAIAELARYGLPPISGGSGEGEGDGGGDDAGDDGDQNDESKGEGDGAAKALDAERKARKAAEKAFKDLQKTVDDLKAKDQTELERTKGDLTKAQQQLEAATAKALERAARSALIDEATKAGAMKPDVVYRLVKDSAEHDDDGEVMNAATLIQQAKKDAPELFRTQQGGGGNGGAQDQQGGESSSYGVSRLRDAYASNSKTKR